MWLQHCALVVTLQPAKASFVCMLQVRHPGAAPNAVTWSSMEEQLLCAVVHEFGPNFAFAADVLAACSQLQGIFRRASQCKDKFKQLTVRLVCQHLNSR